MKRTLNVVYDGKVFRPEEPLDLKPNTRVQIMIDISDEGKQKRPSFLQTARSLKLEGPSDWSARLEDYLYKLDVHE
ncbi:MAG: antitoxin family protein [Deltaproteobacteria bacterium]|nr:antitoxin family protein [Deltaproteobacteria bacterium]